jgi:predicted ArsR family transcriptional regulator
MSGALDSLAYGGRPPFVKGSDTSEAASDSMLGEAAKQRSAVYRAISTAQPPGATCEQVENHLGLKHQAASARIRELVLDGLVIDTGQRRRNTSGRTAAIWTVVPPDVEQSPAERDGQTLF